MIERGRRPRLVRHAKRVRISPSIFMKADSINTPLFVLNLFLKNQTAMYFVCILRLWPDWFTVFLILCARGCFEVGSWVIFEWRRTRTCRVVCPDIDYSISPVVNLRIRLSTSLSVVEPPSARSRHRAWARYAFHKPADLYRLTHLTARSLTLYSTFYSSNHVCYFIWRAAANRTERSYSHVHDTLSTH